MRKAKFFLVAILLLHVIFLLNLKFTAWPEMLFWPYLMLKGWLPYRDIAIAHTPVLLADLTIFFKIFGLGLLQLKIYKKTHVTPSAWVRVKYPHFANLGLTDAQVLKVARAEGCDFEEESFLRAVRKFRSGG